MSLRQTKRASIFSFNRNKPAHCTGTFTAEDAENAEMNETDRLNAITERIISAAIEVHRALGPGLLESAYEACVSFDLIQSGLKVERQKPLPIAYRDVNLDCGYRLDMVIEDSVIVELKAVDQIAPIHRAQLLSYLRLSGCKVGLLINFNVPLLREGIVRVVNNFADSLRSQRARR
jgi:GxxExxY protein